MADNVSMAEDEPSKTVEISTEFKEVKANFKMTEVFFGDEDRQTMKQRESQHKRLLRKSTAKMLAITQFCAQRAIICWSYSTAQMTINTQEGIIMNIDIKNCFKNLVGRNGINNAI